MCELHFQPEDIRRETSYFNDKTGTKFTAKLEKPQHRCDAVPSKLPNCPVYLSTTIHYRESPETKRSRLEESALQHAFAQSVADDMQHREQRHFENLNELQEKLNFVDKKYWTVSKQDESLLICRIIQSPHPKIKLSLVIDPTCAVRVYVNEVEMHTLGDYKVPTSTNDINDLDQLLCNLRKYHITQCLCGRPMYGRNYIFH